MKGNLESSTGSENSDVDKAKNSNFSKIDNEEDGDQDQEHVLEHDSLNHTPVRGTRSLADIYLRYNVAMVEPMTYFEAARSEN